MDEPISAVDAVLPAIRHTAKQLFKPFRFGIWVRLAVLGLLTAESTGGGGGGQIMVPPGSPGGRSESGSGGGLDSLPDFGSELLILGIFLLLLALILGLALLYISAVCRFILFDAVLRDRCRLREGFRRWSSAGWSYFQWQLALIATVIALLTVVVGVPLLTAYATGVFEGTASPWGLIIAFVPLFFLLVIPFLIAVAVATLFARDFVIPIMAMEGLGIIEAWKSFVPRLQSDVLAYLLYVLFKILLSLAGSMILGILTLLIFISPLLWFAALGAATFLAGMAAGLTLNVFTVVVTVVFGLVVFVCLLALGFLVATPVVVFFQAYRIHFFGSRYPRLQEALAAGPFN